jgi:septation ring formation regulator EzrA
MVADTDAESRVAEASQYVTRAHFESVHRQLVDAESEIELLEHQMARMQNEKHQILEVATSHERELSARIKEVEAQLQHSQGQQAAWQRKSKQSVAALCEAVTDLAVLSAKLAEIQTAAEEGDHARLQNALDGSAAIGKRTAVDYLEKYRERRHE